MQSLLEQLESREAILLLYIGGELCAEDIRRVEQMLAGDAVLRSRCDKLRQVLHSGQEALLRLDQGWPSRLCEERALQKANSAFVKALTHPPGAQNRLAHRQRRYPLWAYPLAAAAAVLFAFLGWWGTMDGNIENRISGSGIAIVPENDEQSELALDNVVLVRSMVDDFTRDQQLSGAQAELTALRERDQWTFDMGVMQ